METSGVGSRHYYVALNSLRGICACFVVLYHSVGDGRTLLPVISHGWLFVDFFFVLSGFVIGSSYGQRLADGYSVGRYMTQRFFRIYPVHLFMLALFMAFEIAFATLAPDAAGRRPFDGVYSIDSFFYELFMVQIFFGAEAIPWNGPSWSIAAEFWTYLLFALAIKLRPRLIVPLCLLVAILVPLHLAFLTGRNIAVFHAGALERCLYGFGMGVLCWKLPDRIRSWPIPRWADNFLELGTVAACGVFVWLAAMDRLSLAAPLVFFIAVVVFSRERGFISRLLRHEPFVLLGNLSYSIYMVHWFLLWRFLNMLGAAERVTGLELVVNKDGRSAFAGPAWLQLLTTLTFLGGVVLAAYLVSLLVEEPGRRLGKRVLAWRRPSKIKGVPSPSL